MDATNIIDKKTKVKNQIENVKMKYKKIGKKYE